MPEPDCAWDRVNFRSVSSIGFPLYGAAPRSSRPPDSANRPMKPISTAMTSGRLVPEASAVIIALWWSPKARDTSLILTSGCFFSHSGIAAFVDSSKLGKDATVMVVSAWAVTAMAETSSASAQRKQRFMSSPPIVNDTNDIGVLHGKGTRGCRQEAARVVPGSGGEYTRQGEGRK